MKVYYSFRCLYMMITIGFLQYLQKERWNVTHCRLSVVSPSASWEGGSFHSGPKRGPSLPPETVDIVHAFYEHDDISRIMPGKKDFVSVETSCEISIPLILCLAHFPCLTLNIGVVIMTHRIPAGFSSGVTNLWTNRNLWSSFTHPLCDRSEVPRTTTPVMSRYIKGITRLSHVDQAKSVDTCVSHELWCSFKSTSTTIS